MSSFGSGSGSLSPGDKDDTTIRSKRGELLARISVEKDKVIFRDGQDGTDAYIVESGRIGVFKMTDGKPVRLAVMEKGAIFGEMAAITGAKRTATTIALEPSVVVRISKSQVQQKINACDPFVKALIGLLISNLSRVNERYAVKNQEADKLLNELKAAAEKAAEAEKKLEAEAEAKAAADAEATAKGDGTMGPLGEHGGAPKA